MNAQELRSLSSTGVKFASQDVGQPEVLAAACPAKRQVRGVRLFFCLWLRRREPGVCCWREGDNLPPSALGRVWLHSCVTAGDPSRTRIPINPLLLWVLLCCCLGCAAGAEGGGAGTADQEHLAAAGPRQRRARRGGELQVWGNCLAAGVLGCRQRGRPGKEG